MFRAIRTWLAERRRRSDEKFFEERSGIDPKTLRRLQQRQSMQYRRRR